jgi:hypothetical protein
VELLDEGEDLIAVPDLLFYVGEVGCEEFGEVGGVGLFVGLPEGLLLGDDLVWFV